MSSAWLIAIKIGLAAVLGGAVGAERESTGKVAGLRTHMLISVGAALLTDLSVRVGPLFAAGSQAWDPGRIAAQVVSGIGFIGAGTILHSRGSVHGLTTAAGLWVAAAIGMTVGATLYLHALLGTAALLVILAVLRPLERMLFGDRHSLLLLLPEGVAVGRVVDLLEQSGLEKLDVRLESSRAGRVIRLSFEGSREALQRFELAAAEAGIEQPDGA